MPKSARIGDIGACAIDGPNPLTTGSPDVEINSIPVHTTQIGRASCRERV